MIGQLPGVLSLEDTGTVTNVNASRSSLIPFIDTNAVSVDAATLDLPAAAGTSIAQGESSTPPPPGCRSRARLPDRAAAGHRPDPAGDADLGRRAVVLSHRHPHPGRAGPEIDSEILVGFPAAQKYLHFDGHPSKIYIRTVNTQAATTPVDSLLGAQANPQNPTDVDVAQPSDALTAQADTAGLLS
jgi:putative ABC transport system permease protein